jgi:hypothetical protein
MTQKSNLNCMESTFAFKEQMMRNGVNAIRRGTGWVIIKV